MSESAANEPSWLIWENAKVKILISFYIEGAMLNILS